MKLSVLAGGEFQPDPDIKDITADSRLVRPGTLFAALKGVHSDGADFIPQAEKLGVSAVLTRGDVCERVSKDIAVVVADEPRQKLAEMAARLYDGQPGFMTGITGTNGKTSTAQFASQLWQMLGEAGGSLGTLGVEGKAIDGSTFSYDLAHTTPDPVTLHKALRDATQAGCTHMAMEVSSHGLAQYRADGVKFDVAAFTNITQDHLDYHADFDDYFQAKQRLFSSLLKSNGVAVINKDGAGSDALIEVLSDQKIRTMTTGFAGRDLQLQIVRPQPTGLDLSVKVSGRIYDISLSLVGGFQAENVLLAAGIVIASGFEARQVLPLLGRLKGVPGRMMFAGSRKGAGIYVDYAHTPDAVTTALQAVRPHTQGQLITIIGAGGDRDQSKRPLMGKAAIQAADIVIIADDNPRSENPAVIRQDILAGMGANQENIFNIGDRAEAIVKGIAMLEAGDVLMILGKGHETGQIVGDQRLPFEDAAEVAKHVGVSEV